MVDFKCVIGAKDGKTYQKEVKSPEADNLLKRVIGEKISGNLLGFDGYEFEITGGSDKCGFPMRKGIQSPRKMISIKGKGVGFSGKDRNKNKQGGMIKNKTVCGERITKIIRQVNLKVFKEGAQSLAEEAAPVVGEEAKSEEKSEAPKEEAKVEEKTEAPKKEEKQEKPKEEAKSE
jgi:small subunit ribosomal protein S6e